MPRSCLVGFRGIMGKSKKEKKKKSRSTVRQFHSYFSLFQTCTDFKFIRIYLFFYALDMVNIFPSANVSGHLNDGAVQGGQPAVQCQTDFEIDL